MLALSTYLPLAAKVPAERHEANADVPIFMAHGLYDDIIQIDRAKRSQAILEELKYNIEWHEYPMPHSVCPDEIADISAFLSRLL